MHLFMMGCRPECLDFRLQVLGTARGHETRSQGREGSCRGLCLTKLEQCRHHTVVVIMHHAMTTRMILNCILGEVEALLEVPDQDNPTYTMQSIHLVWHRRWKQFNVNA